MEIPSGFRCDRQWNDTQKEGRHKLKLRTRWCPVQGMMGLHMPVWLREGWEIGLGGEKRLGGWGRVHSGNSLRQSLKANIRNTELILNAMGKLFACLQSHLHQATFSCHYQLQWGSVIFISNTFLSLSLMLNILLSCHKSIMSFYMDPMSRLRTVSGLVFYCFFSYQAYVYI